MNRKHEQQTWSFLGHAPVEVRVIKPGRGVLADRMVESELELWKLCDRYDGEANIYAGLNERRKYLLTGKEGAKKSDIVAVWTIPIDIDPIRTLTGASPAELKELQKQPSTDAELEYAMQAGAAVKLWFRERHLFPLPTMAMSGNGVAMWCAVPRYELRVRRDDKPSRHAPGANGARETWEQKLKAFLTEVQGVIPDELQDKVKIDTNVYDVTRILKVVGTTSVKGDATDDRPHRVSEWIDNPLRIDDDRLLKYILDIDVSLPLPKPQPLKATQMRSESSQTIASLPKLSDTQKNTLRMAMKAPYVVYARQNMTSDRSSGDWAFLKELSKEGIYNPDMLTYALMTAKGTKFARDEKGSYLVQTIENFVNSLPGMSLEAGRRRLGQEFDDIGITSGKMILCGASIGIGKTYCAKEKVIVAMLNGVDVLIVVPSHTLATEWEGLEVPSKLKKIYDEHELKAVVHLYGITHEDVECLHRGVGMKLLGMGHSKLFKAKYCRGVCEKKAECLHLESIRDAKVAPVLIAQHEHSHIHQSFFQLRQIGNDRRMFVVIDEQSQLVHAVRLQRKDIHGNMVLYRAISAEKMKEYEDVYYYDFLARTLEGILKALDGRQDYSVPDRFFAISPTDANKLDAEIARYYMSIERTPKVKNLLWDICYILGQKATLQYDSETDTLLYRWCPSFGNKTVLMLSGTTRREYVEKQIGEPIDGSIAEGWNIRRDNLKVVQLLVGMGGRNRLLKQCGSSTFAKQHGKLFDLILHKHKGSRIALVTSLGENAPDTETDGSAKGKTLRALQPIAKKHGRRLVNMSNEMLRHDIIPNGIDEIPMFHYGMKGIDKLNGLFDVVWSMNGHYYHPTAVANAVFDKFDLDLDGVEPERKDVEFVTTDPKQTFETTKYVYDDPIVEMELEHTQIASMIQTEGRFLREELFHKVFYRSHNVNIPPYPTRVYRSWQALFQYEFAPYVPPEAWLTGKAAEVWQWIESIGDREFTTSEVAQAVKVPLRNVRCRFLDHLISVGSIEIISPGEKGRGNSAVLKRQIAANVDVERT